MDSTYRSADGSAAGQARYRIRVRGHLDKRRSTWFEGMTITREPAGETLLTGEVADQSALYGLLGRVRDLGLTLIALQRIEGGTGAGRPAHQDEDAVRAALAPAR